MSDMTAPVGSRPIAAEYEAREVTLGEVTFYISKPLAEEGFDMLEVLRSGLGAGLKPAIEAFSTTGMKAETVAIAAAQLLASIPTETVRVLRDRLFYNVYFVSGTVPTRTRVAGNTGAAFATLTPGHIYEMIVRSFTVGFTESWPVIESLLFSATESLFPSEPETSTPSSPTPSTPDS